MGRRPARRDGFADALQLTWRLARVLGVPGASADVRDAAFPHWLAPGDPAVIATHRLAVPAAFAFFWAFAAGPWATAGDPADDALASYRESIRPLLAERCYGCHGGLAQEASLRLDTVGLMEQGGDSGDRKSVV